MFYIGIWILAVLFHHMWLQTLKGLIDKKADLSVGAWLFPQRTDFAHWGFAGVIILAVFLIRMGL